MRPGPATGDGEPLSRWAYNGGVLLHYLEARPSAGADRAARELRPHGGDADVETRAND